MSNTMKAKAPAGTFWRGNVLWGRTRQRGKLFRWSLHTSDVEEAARRRQDAVNAPIDNTSLKAKLDRLTRHASTLTAAEAVHLGHALDVFIGCTVGWIIPVVSPVAGLRVGRTRRTTRRRTHKRTHRR
jgi:hypothetical protein